MQLLLAPISFIIGGESGPIRQSEVMARVHTFHNNYTCTLTVMIIDGAYKLVITPPMHKDP